MEQKYHGVIATFSTLGNRQIIEAKFDFIYTKWTSIPLFLVSLNDFTLVLLLCVLLTRNCHLNVNVEVFHHRFYLCDLYFFPFLKKI